MCDIKKFNYVMVGIIIVTVCLIFKNSLVDAVESEGQTTVVADAVAPIISPISSNDNQVYMLVRKMAHIFEFSVLGIELSLLFKKFSIYPFFMILVVGLMDESIQLYSGRDARIQDIWIDFAGGAIGILLGMLKYYVANKLLERKQFIKENKS